MKLKISGKAYQSINTIVNKNLFYTPRKGESITIECVKFPETLRELEKVGAIIIKQID